MSTLIPITGWSGGTLYYAPEEKHLYTRKRHYNGTAYLACYDNVTSHSKKGKRPKCPGKRHVNLETEESRITCHHLADHSNHEVLYRDLISLNAMKDQCRFLAKHFPWSAHKVPIKEIFLLEMAKYATLHPHMFIFAQNYIT